VWLYKLMGKCRILTKDEFDYGMNIWLYKDIEANQLEDHCLIS